MFSLGKNFTAPPIHQLTKLQEMRSSKNLRVELLRYVREKYKYK